MPVAPRRCGSRSRCPERSDRRRPGHVSGMPRPGYSHDVVRAVWTGSLGFGLVSIPVSLYTATEERDISFHQVEAKTGRRVRMRRVVEGSDREIPYEKIVKGYELEDGRL